MGRRLENSFGDIEESQEGDSANQKPSVQW